MGGVPTSFPVPNRTEKGGAVKFSALIEGGGGKKKTGGGGLFRSFPKKTKADREKMGKKKTCRSSVIGGREGIRLPTRGIAFQENPLRKPAAWGGEEGGSSSGKTSFLIRKRKKKTCAREETCVQPSSSRGVRGGFFFIWKGLSSLCKGGAGPGKFLPYFGRESMSSSPRRGEKGGAFLPVLENALSPWGGSKKGVLTSDASF